MSQRFNQTLRYESHRYILENSPFTTKQANVLLWLAEGKTQREIAQIFGVNHRTIEIHLRLAKHKLAANTPAEALAVCFSKGFMKAKEVQP